MDYNSAINILGLQDGAAEGDIKKKFRELASKLHPDVNKEEGAEKKYKEISEAYEYLKSNNYKKKSSFHYDIPGSTFSHFSFSDFFPNFHPFNNGPGPGFTAKSRGNTKRKISLKDSSGIVENINKTIQLDFKEWVIGASREITVSLTEKCESCNGFGKIKSPDDLLPCPTCEKIKNNNYPGNFVCAECFGTGKVPKYGDCIKCGRSGEVKSTKNITIKIPPGFSQTQKLRVPGMGNYMNINEASYAHGDLIISVEVKNDTNMSLDGPHVISDIKIPFLQALTGTKVTIDTISGDFEVLIPEKIKNLETVIIPNLGLALQGNHILKVLVDYPDDKNLNKIIQLLKEDP